MRIAILSTPHVPTPPRGYGASELIAGQLANGLVERGHDVRLFATAGSTTRPRERSVYEECRLATSFDLRELIHVGHALRDLDGCDIVHNHCVATGPALAGISPVPFLTTLHYVGPTVRAFPDGAYVAISTSQATTIRADVPGINITGVVPNGVDPSELPFSEVRDDYLLFLGRFHPNKGADLAIEVANRVGRRLIIAAPAPPDDQRDWFEREIEPRLGGSVEWVGPVEGTQKAGLLGHARATLLPLRWNEPFGLVIAESMACGTPPIAFRRGAAPEIIHDGITGFLVDDVDSMADAVERVGAISPEACRARVLALFSVDRMVDRYLDLYRDYLIRPRASRTKTKLGT